MEKGHAQGAIEYLLIIGAAVIIAVIVIVLMMGLAGQGTGAVDDADVSDIYHDLKVFAKGYTIEASFRDRGTDTFPLNPDVDGCPSCFDQPMVVEIRVDGETLASHTVTTQGEDFSLSANFDGDPNEMHTLQIYYQDCWSGKIYQTGTCDLETCTKSFTESNINQINLDYSNLSDHITDTYGSASAIVVGENWSKTPENGEEVRFYRTTCSDGKLRDKNLEILKLELTNSNGDPIPIDPDVYASSIPTIEFQ